MAGPALEPVRLHASSLENMARCHARYLADDASRGRIADAQRAHVESHYTYRVGLRRVAHRIGELIRTETP